MFIVLTSINPNAKEDGQVMWPDNEIIMLANAEIGH